MSRPALQPVKEQVALMSVDLENLLHLLTFLDDAACDDYGRGRYRPRVQCLQTCMALIAQRVICRYRDALLPAMLAAEVVIENNSAADIDIRVNNLRCLDKALAALAPRDELTDEDFLDCMEGCRVGLKRAVEEVAEGLAEVSKLLNAIELANQKPVVARPAIAANAKPRKVAILPEAVPA